MIGDIVIIVVLIAINGLFALSEMAIISSRRHRLQQMAKSHPPHKGAIAALALSEDPTRFLSTVQIGITLVGIVAGAFGGASLSDPFGEWLDQRFGIAPYGYKIAFATVVFTIGVFSLIFGELVPKRLALVKPEAVAAAVAPMMRTTAICAGPLVWLLGAVTDGILSLAGAKTDNKPQVTEEEVKTLIAEGAESGAIEPAERRMIEGVMRLPDRSVRSIMTPRGDVVWIDIDDDPATVLKEMSGSTHSRFPVCRGAVDEVIGIVATKTLLEQMLTRGHIDLATAMVAPLVVHDGTPLLRLLELFRTSAMPLGVVVDEYGSVQGLVALTDVLEVIAGSFGEDGEDVDPHLLRREDGSWLVDGLTPLDEVETVTGIGGLAAEGEDGDFHTIAGFLLHRLGRVPRATEAVVWRGHRFEVVDMDGRRIDKVLIAEVAP